MKLSRRSFLQIAAGAPVAVALSSYSPIVPARTVKLPTPAFVVAETQRWELVNIALPKNIMLMGLLAGGYVLDWCDAGFSLSPAPDNEMTLQRAGDTVRLLFNCMVFASLPLNGQMNCTVFYECGNKKFVTSYDLYGPRNLPATVKG